MFRDTKEELRRLEEELLAAEREASEMARADRLLEEFLAEEDDYDDSFEEDFMQDYPAGLVAGQNGYRNYSNNYGRSANCGQPQNYEQAPNYGQPQNYARSANYGQAPNYGRSANYAQSRNYGRPQTPPPVYNTDWTDGDLEEYSEEVYQEPKEDLRGLVVLAMFLLAGILGMLAFWAVRYL